MMPTDKLTAVLWEADRHLDTLTEALAEWNVSPTITWQALESDRARVRIVDQLLFRFVKLQDTVGERLIPATLANLREPFEDWPMRDRLNRLEKLGCDSDRLERIKNLRSCSGRCPDRQAKMIKF